MAINYSHPDRAPKGRVLVKGETINLTRITMQAHADRQAAAARARIAALRATR